MGRNIDHEDLRRPLRGIMDNQPSSSAPDVASVLKFATSLVWRSKWLIGAATIVAATVAFALSQADTVQAWSGRTTMRIGLAPTVDYILLMSGAAITAVEAPRSVVARISNAAFRDQIVRRAAFEPATAAVSRAMVSSSLRAIDLNNDRDVAVELSAGSAADVQAAFRAIAAEIDGAHGEIINRRLQLLQVKIDEAKSRIALIEKSSDQLMDRIFNTGSDDKTKLNPAIFSSIPAWNNLQDRIQHDTNLKELIEPSVLHLDTGTYLQGPRPIAALKASILAGLTMLLAMIVLTIVVGTRVRPSAG
jgi:hypothetical protein